ncbi:ABC transporter ATP-binding protein [Staphylococcus hominis]|uniref:ABC transporter ATP-binding protein n=1 Tax=Staphylococcus hominis TaxID=1290 RepID=UPI001F57AF46|nr:ABC transporter ATP-binding protein [Staphylococcus hominis]MCI2842964.1 ABC transporter ATP-binding protein [Staphylococcus hominis]MCI2851839.1 ABC transporter ATP-binding protein [Staphylococcus hominis]MCI2858863.1 ABC transporter ATP-binding protein [Staphylococcus hominis]MDS3891944.1 ABC transporter ATP-binding protein [Staphylococcus hominis]
MIQIRHLSKKYNGKTVLKNISLNIEKGMSTALIGKNGAGKSTLINILINHLKAETGEIIDIDHLLNLNHIGVLFQKTSFPRLIKVKELYKLFSQLYKDAISIDEFKKITKLNDSQLNLYANHLSGGQQRILDFGLCLIGKPKLLILDEPTAAMDVEMREHFWTMIGKLKKENVSIFYTSHYIEEVERMADKVIFLDQGIIKLNDSPRNILTNQQYSIIKVPNTVDNNLQNLTNYFDVKIEDTILKIKTSDVKKVIYYLEKLNINLNDMTIEKQTLLETILFADVKEGGTKNE